MLLNAGFGMTASHSADGIEFLVADPAPPARTPAAGPPRVAEIRSRSGREPAGPSIACDIAAGVVEIRDPRLLRRGQEDFCRALVESAVLRSGALRAATDLETSTCRLEFGPGRFDAEELARRTASAVRSAIPSVRPDLGDAAHRESGEDLPSNPRRMKHLMMAGGSLGLTAAAIVLPGLPTLPFLVMTGRHAALASPRIERWLKGRPWTAALFAEDESASELIIDWKTIAKWVGLAVFFAAVILLLHPPMPVLLAMEFGVMALIGCWEWLRPGDAAEALSLAF